MNTKPDVALYFPRPYSAHRPVQGAPLPLLAISSLLDKEGYGIKVVSNNLHERPLEKVLEHCQGAVCLGISSMTGYQIVDALQVAKTVKGKYPELPVIWGGRHPTLEPEGTINSPYVDVVVSGQGERTFTELVHALTDGKPLDNIAGISYKLDGEIFHNPERPPEDINNFPAMPYHLIDVKKILESVKNEPEDGPKQMEMF